MFVFFNNSWAATLISGTKPALVVPEDEFAFPWFVYQCVSCTARPQLHPRVLPGGPILGELGGNLHGFGLR